MRKIAPSLPGKGTTASLIYKKSRVRYVDIASRGSSDGFDPARAISESIQDALKDTTGPVTLIDPTSVHAQRLSIEDDNASKAFILAKKYADHNLCLKDIARKGRTKKLSLRQVEAVFKIVLVVKKKLSSGI